MKILIPTPAPWHRNFLRKLKILYTHRPIGLVGKVLADGPENRDSIPGQVNTKDSKMVLDSSLLKTQHNKVRIKGKVEQSRQKGAPSPTPRCSRYWKGSFLVALDDGQPTLLIYIWILRFYSIFVAQFFFFFEHCMKGKCLVSYFYIL